MKTVHDKANWIKKQLDAGEQVWFYADEPDILWDYLDKPYKHRLCLITEEDDFDQINGRLYFSTEYYGVDFTQINLKSTAEVNNIWDTPVNEEIYCYE